MLHKLITLVIVLLCFFQQANAQFEEGIVMPPAFGLPALTATTLLNGSNNTTTYVNQGENTATVLNVISLKIKEGQGVYFASNFTATATLDLQLTNAASTVTNQQITLTVNYDTTTGAKYTVRDYKTFKDYRIVKVTFNGDINITGASGWDPKLVLEVENEMRIIRYYSLSGVAGNLIPSITTAQPTNDVLQVNWTFPPAAHENMTQIEWAYVETEMLPFYNGNYNLLFQNNSTRVDLDYSSTGYSFKVPLLYPGAGKLYYRTRAVYRKANGTLITGNWATVSESQNSFAFAGHQDNLNWQSSSTFAEGGKYKTVIEYFDGSLRSRQTVTKDNTTGNTIVGETIYDLQGRPNIQILPTPTTSTSIQYFNNFNRFNGMQVNEDPAKYFDLTPEAVKCNATMSLDSNCGNGRYFSGNNDWLGTEAKSKFIPNAQGYAYTETRFTDDATQRLKSQGGVGANLQLNSGHEVKYYYGKPSQPELDALFGTEAGDASHYSKNMVRDPNGQTSVSYVDMHGRTVATALAGDPTVGIDSIINNTDYPLATGVLRNDLLTPATNIIQGNSIVSVSTILAPATTAYNFTYKLNPAILQLLSCTNQPICFDCKYDLEISIKGEDCGNDVPVIKRYNNLQLVPANQACNTSMGFIGQGITVPTTQINFDTTLAAGSYIIRKTLTINDSLFQARRDSAIKVLLCKTKDSIYQHLFDSLAVISGCGATPAQGCDSCLANLGSYVIYRAKYLAAVAPLTPTELEIHTLYSADSTECAMTCGGGGINPNFQTLKGYRGQMLADMIPFTGQYATDTIRTLGGSPVLNSLDARFNIFTQLYTGPNPSPAKPFYNKPNNENGQPNYYTDDNLVDGSIHGLNGGTIPIIDTITKMPFAGLFQNSWATSLIKYHPEYTKLQFAEGELWRAFNWLDNVQNCITYQTAVDSNFINPVRNSTSTINDPYFLKPNTTADKNAIDNKLYSSISTSGNGPSIWQIANSTVLCKTVDSAHKYACILQTDSTGIDPLITNQADKDIVWDKFKTIYLSYRNEMVLQYINTYAIDALSQADMNQLTLTEGKELIFAKAQDIANQNGWSWWQYATNGNDTTGLGGSVGGYLDSNAIDKCAAQRPFWKARLLQCDILKARLNLATNSDTAFVNNVINTILDSLVMICRNSITPQQPYGASTVNAAYVGNPRSFEAVINNVFNNNGIQTVPGDHYFCNPFTVDFPKPFGLNPPLSVNYTNKLDSCACNRFAVIKTEAVNAGYNPASLSSMNQFLKINYNDTLTAVLWTGLQSCDSSYMDTCCTDPVITSMSIIPQTGYSFIRVNYQLPAHCENCSIFMYDQNNNLYASYNNICGSTYSLFEVVDTCVHYKFLIKCEGSSCGLLVSDTAYNSGCATGCNAPVITSVYGAKVKSLYKFVVEYQLPTSCESCRIEMYNASNNLVQTNYNICGSNMSVFGVADTCALYHFVIICEGVVCGTLVSNTVYNPGCNTNPGCTTPVINSVVASKFKFSYRLTVNYQLPTSCETCRIEMYNLSNTLIQTIYNICGTSSSIFTVADTCTSYYFVIKCEGSICGTLQSSPFYRYGYCWQDKQQQNAGNLVTISNKNPGDDPGSANMSDPCLVFKPITLTAFVPLPSFFNCGYVKPCISCSTLVNVLTPQFRALYPSYNGVPFLDSTTTDDQGKQNALWARFLNFRTGFSKNALDYMAAYKNCTAGNPPVNALCAFDKPMNDPSDIFPTDSTPCKNVVTQAQFIADLLFTKMKDSLLANFDSLYKARCLAAQSQEEFYVTYQPKEYHYILYYYDQAGNLTKTIPPAAVKPNYNSVYLANVVNARNSGTSFTNPNNNEILATQYRYNSLNQVITQRSPDGGISNFWYDRLGRLVISQNAKQLAQSRYSYTLYDDLGRTIQVGQKPQTNPMSQTISQDHIALQNWIDDKTTGGSLREQITRTVYDVSYYDADDVLCPGYICQKNLRNRVSYTQVIDAEPSNGIFAGVQSSATYYSYDIHGSVDTLLQDLNQAMVANGGNRYKKIVYDYDMISGKVNQVSYQRGYADQFYHKYIYDATNRMTEVRTSHDSIYWENEAAYDYYRHGPSSRTVLGNNQVQGIDYAYTIQGWLKGVNTSAAGNAKFDMGTDGRIVSVNEGGMGVAGDAYGYSLNYFNGDYIAIGSNANPFVDITANLPAAGDGVQLGGNLYNGNIRATLVNIPKLGDANLYGYRYDQLSRIKAMNNFTGFDNGSNDFGFSNTPVVSNNYKERVSYDPNGNIKSYLRNGNSVRPSMDDIGYTYKAGTNQLDKVVDVAPDASPVDYDKYNDIKQGQANGNYQYDAIGNLVSDVSEGITNISWTMYGKIQTIVKANTTINYTYDASGNRISKSVTVNGTSTKTIYVRDASGNITGLYAIDANINGGALTQTEINMYGTNRLGVYNISRNVSTLTTIDYLVYSGKFTRGNKLFELINHLGNVLVTISDKKIGVDNGVYQLQCFPGFGCNTVLMNGTPDGIADYYKPDVITANDYYPFGMQMPGRSFNSRSYRYGFQRQEKNDEIIAGGNAIDYKYRVDDVRIGRFFSVDPLSAKYPYNSPYAFSENVVINAVELEGLEKVDINDLGINPNSTRNANGTYTFTKGGTTYANVPMIERGGNKYLDLTSYLKGAALYYDSKAKSGDGWISTAQSSMFPVFATIPVRVPATATKLSIDNNIFSPPYNASWDDKTVARGVNCSGVVFRNKTDITRDPANPNYLGDYTVVESYLANPAKATKIIPGTVLKEGDNLVTYQRITQMQRGYYSASGAFMPVGSTVTFNDFHIVGAPLGPGGKELPNYVWSNGPRPVYSYVTKADALLPKYWPVLDSDNNPTYFPSGPGPSAGKREIYKLTMTQTQYILK
jgi:hypothetical protein